jgi:predicted permease
MKSAMARVDRDYPALFNPARRVALISAHKMFTHSSTPIVAMLGFMAAAVLLLGCVNISMLFLARLLERSRELALRTALGASQIRLMRQCLLESALVILLGLVAGYGLAALGVRWTEGISSFLAQILAAGRGGNLPALRSMDFVAAIIAAAAIWLLSTLVPAWRIGKRDAAAVLAGSGKGDGARGSNRSVAFLVGLQVVISCLVLVMCGSLVLAVNGEVNQPTGLNTANVMMSVAPTTFGARHAEASQRLRYWDNLTAAITKRIPGAEVAFTTAAPTRPNRVPASIDSEQDRQKQATLTLPLAVVSENYFRLLDVHLRSGRLFDSTDNQASLNVTVVDEQLAARYWPDGKVLGKRIHLNSADGGQWLTIVGIVSSVTGRPYRDEEIGVAYQPLRQAVPEEFQVLVRLPNAANGSRAALRAAAFEADRDLALQNLQMVDDYIAALKLSWTAMVPVVTVVAIITAILAASGLFGLITRSVAQRTHEVGIRRALGATAWRSTSMFRRQGALYLSISVVGIGGGVVATTLLSSTITNILEHVFPATVGVVLLTALVIFTASYLPTRRAVALEPGDALHYE